MFSVCKSFKIPIGHRLTKARSLCANFHGHNLKIDITIQREKLNENDMVIDFYDLKTIVNEILDQWDHSMIINEKDMDQFSIIKNCPTQRMVKVTFGDPTSENMCFILFNMLCEKFTKVDSHLRLKSVTVWESDESYARYEE